MKKVISVGLDVHKESIVVATAPHDDTTVELYGPIGGTLEALDKLIKKLEQADVELRFVYEAGRDRFHRFTKAPSWCLVAPLRSGSLRSPPLQGATNQL